MDSDSNFFQSLLGFLMTVYFIISQIMSIVFFVGYCKTDPILEIIFIDSILSEIKGFLWIFFIW